MKGIEKITAHIEADASAEAQAILDEAKAKVNQIEADYSQRAQDIYETMVKNGKAECDAKVENMNRLATMESKKAVLETKQEMVTKAFDKAQEMVLELPEDEYQDFLVRLVVESASTGKESVIFNERDKKKFGAAVVKAANEKLKEKGMNAELTEDSKTANIAGGVVLSQEGIEVNNSLELLVDMCRGSMSSKLAEVMFE